VHTGLLHGMGVGDQQATASSAAVQWALRDGAGMFGGIWFTYLFSSRFGGAIKQWRLFADCINDLGLTLELLAPLFPQHFLLVACAGTLCRSLCGVAAGATRASLMQHFSHGSAAHIADIAAKEGTQESAVTLIGMALGVQMARLVGDSTGFKWGLFVLLTLVHVYANHNALMALALTSLDEQRAWIVVKHYAGTGAVLSPRQVSRVERLWGWQPPRKVHFGVSPRAVVSSGASSGSSNLESQMRDPHRRFLLVEGRAVSVVLHMCARFSDVLQCMLVLLGQPDSPQSFVALLKEKGWDVEGSEVHTGPYRATWHKKEE
jgi:hypothetical protein